MRRLVKSKKILRNQNHNELYTTPSLTGGCCIFYTDMHDVDEDKVSIVPQGGRWSDHGWSGITHRNMNSISSATDGQDNVASRLIYLS